MIKPNFTTLTQCKSLLGITDATYDTLLTNYIPIVNDFLLGTNGYLNNEFMDDYSGVQDSTTQFTMSNVINIALGGVFVIDGQTQTEYLINTIDYDDKILTTDTTPSILSDVTLRIRSLPYGGKLTACQMVMYMVLKASGATFAKGDVKSESIGTYSYTMQDNDKISAGGYPKKYLDALNIYRTVKFI